MCLTKGETVFLDFCREQEITGFASVDREAVSYWEGEDTSVPPMSVYGFDTPAEMQECLLPYIKNEKLRRILAAEAFQSIEEQQEEGGNVERMPCEDLLPAYVYNF